MKLFFISAISCLALLSGCQQAEEITISNEKLRMSIEASVGKDGMLVGRSAMDDNGNMSFQDKDEIGLSVNEGNFVKWTLTNSTWQQNPETMYWEDKTEEHEFCAFYPFDSTATLTDVPMPNLSLQTGEKEKIGKYDFLIATKGQSYGSDGTVSFSGDYAFEHVLSLITINLKGEGDLVASKINNVSLIGSDIATPYKYSFENSEVESISDEIISVDTLMVSKDNFSLTTTGHTFYFVVNPGTVELANVNLIIEYVKGTSHYVARLEGLGQPDDDESKFEGGKQYNYSLKVRGDKISVSGNEIKEWGEGCAMDDIIIGREENQISDES